MPCVPRWCGLGLLLLALSFSLRAAADGERCGSTATSNPPWLPAVAHLSPTANAKVIARRKRLLEGKRACGEHNPRTTRYLRAILARLVKGSRLEGFAAEAPALEIALDCSIPLPIALATTGKFMLVPRALPALAESEDAIAAVLGHELAHVTLRHTEQLLNASSGPLALTPPATRALAQSHEREADVAGLRLTANAGYDPHATIDHLRRVEELATAWERSGRLPRQRPETVHDRLEVRTQRLTAQIRACGYHSATRTPVPPDVRAELSAPALAAAKPGAPPATVN